MKKKVSVVMPVYNGEKFLRKAIDSILTQTYDNFEFIIVNDGSTDKTSEILESYKDCRIKVLKNEINKGVIFSLNRGIRYSTGAYIVRMDADDISLPKRIEKQVNFMEENKDIDMCSCGGKYFISRCPFIYKTLTSIADPEEIKSSLVFRCCIMHPGVIIRSETLRKKGLYYEEPYKTVEDFALWQRFAEVGKISNMPEVLLKYRVVSNSITRTSNKDMNKRKEAFSLIYKPILEAFNIFDERSLKIHFEICMIQNLKKSEYSLKEKEEHLKLLIKRNKKYHKEFFQKECAREFLKNCIYCGNYAFYKRSFLFKYYRINKLQYYKEKIICKLKGLIKKIL